MGKEANHFSGNTMHIDVSKRFYQKGVTGVAFKIIPSQEHRGIVISNKLKKELKRDIDANEDYARIYAICIYYLIKDKLNLFDNLVICNDETYVYVKNYLDLLFQEDDIYFSKFITSLSKLREISGNPKIRSYADNIANVYRRKGLRSDKRKQKGIKLNLVEINYKKIIEKWKEIDKKIK